MECKFCFQRGFYIDINFEQGKERGFSWNGKDVEDQKLSIRNILDKKIHEHMTLRKESAWHTPITFKGMDTSCFSYNSQYRLNSYICVIS